MSEYFLCEDEQNWTHKRCEQEIAKYHAMADGGKKGAEVRWGKLKGRHSPPNDPPMLTNNQEPITTTHIKTNRIAPKVAIPIGVSESVWNDFSAASSKFPSLLLLSHDPKFRRTWFRLFPFHSPA